MLGCETMYFEDNKLVDLAVRAVQTRSYSDEEGDFAALLLSEMKSLDFDEAYIDRVGNVVGRVGDGPVVIHFDGHMDTVEVNDADLWEVPPFEGRIVDGVHGGQHMPQLGFIFGLHHNNAGDAAHHGDIEQSVVCGAVIGREPGAVHAEAHRQLLQQMPWNSF